jgi:hypothetical protein
MVFLLFFGELVHRKLLGGSSDSTALYPLRTRVKFLPIGKDFDDEFDDACVFTEIRRSCLFKGDLHDDADDVLYLLYLYLIERVSF